MPTKKESDVDPPNHRAFQQLVSTLLDCTKNANRGTAENQKTLLNPVKLAPISFLAELEHVNASDDPPDDDELGKSEDIDAEQPSVESVLDHIIENSRNFDQSLAAAMIKTARNDLSGKLADYELDEPGYGTPDFFGAKQDLTDPRVKRVYCALAWIFDMHEEQPVMPFELACEELGLDAERMRRIIAANMRTRITELIELLADVVNLSFAENVRDQMDEYLNLEGLSLHLH